APSVSRRYTPSPQARGTPPHSMGRETSERYLVGLIADRAAKHLPCAALRRRASCAPGGRASRAPWQCASRAPWPCASRAPSRRRGTALHAAQQLSKTLRPAAERCAQVLCSGAPEHAQALATPWLLLRLTLAQSLRHCCCASAARLVACVTTEGITMF